MATAGDLRRVGTLRPRSALLVGMLAIAMGCSATSPTSKPVAKAASPAPSKPAAAPAGSSIYLPAVLSESLPGWVAALGESKYGVGVASDGTKHAMWRTDVLQIYAVFDKGDRFLNCTVQKRGSYGRLKPALLKAVGLSGSVAGIKHGKAIKVSPPLAGFEVRGYGMDDAGGIGEPFGFSIVKKQ